MQAPSAFPPPPTRSAAAKVVEPLDTTDESPSTAQRERAAEEAIMASLQHVVHQYIRRDVEEQMGESDTLPPSEFIFSPTTPKYWLRLLLTVALGSVGFTTVVGPEVVVLLVVWGIATYITDFLGHRRGSILVLTGGAVVVMIAVLIHILRSAATMGMSTVSFLSVSLLITVALSTVMTHYRWLQKELPELVVFLERYSMNFAPLAAIPSLLAVCVAIGGVRLAPFPFAGSLCALHAAFHWGYRSSFVTRALSEEDADVVGGDDAVFDSSKGRKSVRPISSVEAAVGPEDSVVYLIVVIFLPAAVYLAMQSDLSSDPMMHISSLCGLLGMQVVYLLAFLHRVAWFTRCTSVSQALLVDPYGFWELLGRYRLRALLVSYCLLLHGGVYRLLHSRFQTYFTGIPPPYNGMLLLLLAYGITIIAILAYDRLYNDAKTLVSSTLLILLSVVCSVTLAVVFGMPPFFHPIAALSAVSFMAFLFDRTRASFMPFCFLSSLLLVWWMYRTFSFIAMDLHVLNDTATVHTTVVAFSIIWCYMLGAFAFAASFDKRATSLVMLWGLLAIKVGWVEHVLYSQREEGAYSPLLVLGTTLLGSWTAWRLYRHERMSLDAAAILIALYVSKTISCVAELGDAEFAHESAADEKASAIVWRASQFMGVWLAAILASFTVALTELRRAAKLPRSHNVGLVFAVALVPIVLGFRGFARAVSESLFQDPAGQANAATGLQLLMGGSSLLVFLTRNSRNVLAWPALQHAAVGCCVCGVALFTLRPSSIAQYGLSVELEIEGPHVVTGRRYLMVSLIGALAMGIQSYLPRPVPELFRMLYMFALSLLTTMGMHFLLLPASNVVVAGCLFLFLFLSLMTVEVCHFHTPPPWEPLLVYGVAIFGLAAAVAASLAMDPSAATMGNVALAADLRAATFDALLATMAGVSIFIAVLCRCRYQGAPLLRHSVAMNANITQTVGLIGNFATALTLIAVWVLSFASQDPVVDILSAMLLLLLVDDGVLCLDLTRGAFRYFPPYATAVGLCAVRLFGGVAEQYHEGISLGTTLRPVGWWALIAPSHIHTMWLLWNSAHTGRMAPPRSAIVVGMLVVDVVALFASHVAVVQWLSLLGIVGHASRLYGAKLFPAPYNPL